MSTESTPAGNPVADALAAYAATLRPEAIGQLSALWSDLRDQPPGIVRDLVELRINRPDVAHFKLPVPDAATACTEAVRQAFIGQIKASVDRVTGRDSGAPGLGGMYAQGRA